MNGKLLPLLGFGLTFLVQLVVIAYGYGQINARVSQLQQQVSTQTLKLDKLQADLSDLRVLIAQGDSARMTSP